MKATIFRLVTLDVTNTMIKVAGSPGKQYGGIAAKFGIEADEDALTSAFYRHYKAYSGKYPNFGASVNMSSKQWWTGVILDTFVSVGVARDNKQLAPMARELYHYFATAPAWTMLPGTIEALEELRKYQVKVGVISNWDHRLYKVLGEMGLRSYFDFVLPSAVVGVEKPNPLIFRRALDDAGVTADEAVHFGDNVQKDFIGARNMGITAYLMETEGVNNNFLHEIYVVKTVADFIKAITPYLIPR